MLPDISEHQMDIRDARVRKMGRDSLRKNKISTFAADGTPLPELDTSEAAMRKNRSLIAALLNWGKNKEDK